MESINVIAEIGCNHMGDMAMARQLIKSAKLCNARVAKFQKRDIDTWTGQNPELYHNPHPSPWNAFGPTYREHRIALELTADEHKQLKDWCAEVEIMYSTSVWDCVSAEQIIPLDPELLKVPSACNNNIRLLEVLRDNYSGQVHVSTGMTTPEEIDGIVETFEKTGQAASRLVLYACTSGYPVPIEDVCLLEIKRLKDRYGDRILTVGFSGHHKGIAIDNAAVVLGAEWVERHFTLDRTLRGTDHAASLEPQGLSKLVRDLENTRKALRYKPDEMLEIERVQREKLKFRSR